MKELKEICCVIQARTQSTRVINKMLRPFAGSSLFEIAVDKILQSKIPKENFYVSVLDQELIDVAKRKNVNVFLRSEESTQEPITVQKALEWRKLPYKYWMIVNACNPLLKVSTINAFVDAYCASDSTGMFGVLEKKTFLYGSDHRMLNRFFGSAEHLATLETKMTETCYEGAHTLYAGSMNDLEAGVYMGTFANERDPEFFVLDEQECYDIDWPSQFELAEKVYLSEL